MWRRRHNNSVKEGDITMYDRVKDNAHRLASVLNDYSDNKDVVTALAHYLNYIPEQLAEDMKDVRRYIKRLETDESEN